MDIKAKTIKLLKKIIVKIFKILYKVLYRVIPVDENLVIFIAYHGRGVVGNPKYIYQAMQNDDFFKDKKKIWMVKHRNRKNVDGDVSMVSYNSPLYFFYMARAKYWVVNCKLPMYMYKKENQIYLQTWHGTPLKRLAKDIINENQKFYRSQISYDEMVKTYEVDSSKYDFMIAPNKFCEDIFPGCFGVDKNKLITTGYPRNDYLINNKNNENLKDQIKKEFNIPKNKKIILYAPTWRDDTYSNKGYTFKLKLNLDKWKEKLSDEYILLFKPHYLIVNEDIVSDEFVYKIDADVDINKLYLISDCLVTDYSSVFFDYANLNKPIYFYMFDLSEYRDNLRGFYLDIYKDLPGNIYEDEQELIENIKCKNFDFDKLKAFNHRFNTYEEGKASQRVVDILKKKR